MLCDIGLPRREVGPAPAPRCLACRRKFRPMPVNCSWPLTFLGGPLALLAANPLADPRRRQFRLTTYLGGEQALAPAHEVLVQNAPR